MLPLTRRLVSRGTRILGAGLDVAYGAHVPVLRHSSAVPAREVRTRARLGGSSALPVERDSSVGSSVASADLALNQELLHAPLPSEDPVTRRGQEIRAARKVNLDFPTTELQKVAVATNFAKVGVNTNLVAMLSANLPSIQAPTPTQAVLIPTLMAKPRSDLILRAQTGNGKSFGALLALLSQPRLRLTTTVASKAQDGRPSLLTKPAVSALILVPSNDLALQYRDWARHVLPPQSEESLRQLDPILQVLVRKDPARSDTDQLRALRDRPPHVLVATPTRLREIMDDARLPGGGGRSLLGLRTMRTLVLDEVDALFQLPGRYPTRKEVLSMERHPPPGLSVVNDIMRLRPTLSGAPSDSIENDPSSHPSSKRLPPSKGGHRRRQVAMMSSQYATPLPRNAMDQRGVPIPPLQLVAISATANSVLRRFLSSRTGWLRIGARERRRFTGQWIDLTGQSQLKSEDGNRTDLSSGAQLDPAVRLALEPGTMPPSIEHYALVVDDVVDGQTANRCSIDPDQTPLPGLRNLYTRPSKSERRQDDELVETTTQEHIPLAPGQAFPRSTPKAVPAYVSPERALDYDLVETVAYVYASVPADNAVVLIPTGWSQTKVVEHLQSLGLPAQGLKAWNPSNPSTASNPKKLRQMYILAGDQARGIHVPDVSHVFILTTEAVKSPQHYTHLAGRAARLQPAPSDTSEDTSMQGQGQKPVEFGRRNGQVYTIVRGVPHTAQGWTTEERSTPPSPSEPQVVSSEEMRLGGILAGLNVEPKVFPLAVEKDSIPPPEPSQPEAQSVPVLPPKQNEIVVEDEQDDQSDWMDNPRSWEYDARLSPEQADQEAIKAHREIRRRAQAEIEAELAKLDRSDRPAHSKHQVDSETDDREAQFVAAELERAGEESPAAEPVSEPAFEKDPEQQASSAPKRRRRRVSAIDALSTYKP